MTWECYLLLFNSHPKCTLVAVGCKIQKKKQQIDSLASGAKYSRKLWIEIKQKRGNVKCFEIVQ